MSYRRLFSCAFLDEIAMERQLTQQETEVFIMLFGKGQSYEEIASELKIEKSAVQKRMGQIYRKFKISGASKGKEVLLRKHLTEQRKQTGDQLLEDPISQDTVDSEIKHELNDLKSKLSSIQERLSLRDNQKSLSTTHNYNDPIEFIDCLIERVKQGESPKAILEEFGNGFPALIEHLAANSEYSESHIAYSSLRCAKNFIFGVEKGLPDRYISELNQPVDGIDPISF